MSTRLCKRCDIEKDVSDFPIDKRNPLWENKICKKCNGIRNNLNGKPFKRKWNWLRRGFSKEEWDKVEELIPLAQGCFLCGKEPPLDIDHDHKTGRFRGMLCNSCNRGLGFFKDSPELLRKAADYVDKNSKVVYN